MHVVRLQALEHQQHTMLQTPLNALNVILNLRMKHDKINLESKSMLEHSDSFMDLLIILSIIRCSGKKNSIQVHKNRKKISLFMYCAQSP